MLANASKFLPLLASMKPPSGQRAVHTTLHTPVAVFTSAVSHRPAVMLLLLLLLLQVGKDGGGRQGWIMGRERVGRGRGKGGGGGGAGGHVFSTWATHNFVNVYSFASNDTRGVASKHSNRTMMKLLMMIMEQLLLQTTTIRC